MSQEVPMEKIQWYSEFAKTLKERRDNHALGVQLKKGTHDFVDNLLAILFPHFCKEDFFIPKGIESHLVLLERDLKKLILPLLNDTQLNIEEVTMAFMKSLPRIHDLLWLDAQAITNGDPAAESIDEVILAYPGFTAIAMFRIAHEFYCLQVPIFPRIITEYAHQMTGIDIHPGAKIGNSFAIDHGTGIVIGESAIIGENVKMYQGVTLGALSVEKKLAKSKRHPTLEDNVVVYAQAVILGGDTIIGHHSIIGGNVWLTESVPAFSVVFQESKATIRPKQLTGTVLDFSI
jgi:serine O-acetyltransferase